MFSYQRNPRPRSKRKQKSKHRPIRPFLETLEDRITPTSGPDFPTNITVSNVAQLQNAITNANDNMSGAYVIGLNPGTYTLSAQLKLSWNAPQKVVQVL